MKCYRDGSCGPYEMYSCNECPASKPEYLNRNKVVTKTVVEHIRAMNDEEFALFLTEDGWGCHNCSEDERLSDNPFRIDDRCDEDCYTHCLEWLHSKMR